MTWIAVGGRAGAGKDYILEKICKYEAGQKGNYVVSGFGDLVRAELGIQDPKERRSEQQAHGQACRQLDENYWTKRAVEWAGGFPKDVVIGFTGVRFKNELDVLQAAGFRVGLIEAPEEVRLARLEARDGRPWTAAELGDVTETSLDQIPRWRWDWIWSNG